MSSRMAASLERDVQLHALAHQIAGSKAGLSDLLLAPVLSQRIVEIAPRRDVVVLLLRSARLADNGFDRLEDQVGAVSADQALKAAQTVLRVELGMDAAGVVVDLDAAAYPVVLRHQRIKAVALDVE